MADSAITDYSGKTTVHGEELIEVVDLRESAAANQNKKMTTDTLLASMVTYENDVVCYEGEVVYT